MSTPSPIPFRAAIVAGLMAISVAVPAGAQVDLAGNWAALYHEDLPDRIPGPELGDYSGIPINDAARLRADSYDADRISVVSQYECRLHGADYSMRGFANLRIDPVVDPQTQRIVAIHTRMAFQGMERTIWLDGRPHPSELAPHTWQGFARRFIAGETTREAIDAARVVEGRGLLITLDHLGESVGTLARADAATREYFEVVQQVIDSGIGRNLSLKLTQLGLTVDRATCVDNMRRVLDRAEPAGFFIRIDMEGSAHTEATLEIFETLWGLGYRQMGVVLQAALYRTEEDLPRVLRLGARVRLVKGA